MRYALILFSLLILTACTTQTGQTKVGALLPLTGDYASIGAEIQRGIELANDDTAHPVRIIYEDVGAMTPAKAVAPANKVLNTDKIIVGLVADSQNAVVLGPIFSEHNTPLVVLWDSSDTILNSGSTVFSTGFSSEKSAQAMADYAYDTLQLRSVAIVKQQDPYAITIATTFAARFAELGGNIVFNEEAGINEQNFQTMLLKIKNTNADGIYLAIVPQSEVNFVTQVRELNMDETLLAADWFFQDTIDAAGDAAEGVYVHTIYVDDEETLKQKYIAKYNAEPSDITVVGIGYTGMQKVLQALESGKPVQQALEEEIGPSRTLNRAEKIYKVVDGKIVRMN
jgi:branched-chain amino acid transport system substrate-binding protein